MDKLIIKEILGKEIFSRNNVRKLNSMVDKDKIKWDFQGVSFISRSAADELENILETYHDIEIFNVEPPIDQMLKIVKSGRSSERRNHSRVKRSTTYVCNTIEDVRQALLSSNS